jgi:hypothetical protein
MGIYDNYKKLLSKDEISLLNSIHQEAGGNSNKAKQLLCIHQIEQIVNSTDQFLKNQVQSRLHLLRFYIKKEVNQQIA